jgi:hypothetical protein
MIPKLPTGKLPNAHVTSPLAVLQAPRLELTDMRSTPAGKEFVKATPVAVIGPELVMNTV